jgi:hypothetical protein
MYTIWRWRENIQQISLSYESPEGSFEIRDSISEIRDSTFNILINQVTRSRLWYYSCPTIFCSFNNYVLVNSDLCLILNQKALLFVAWLWRVFIKSLNTIDIKSYHNSTGTIVCLRLVCIHCIKFTDIFSQK